MKLESLFPPPPPPNGSFCTCFLLGTGVQERKLSPEQFEGSPVVTGYILVFCPWGRGDIAAVSLSLQGRAATVTPRGLESQQFACAESVPPRGCPCSSSPARRRSVSCHGCWLSECIAFLSGGDSLPGQQYRKVDEQTRLELLWSFCVPVQEGLWSSCPGLGSVWERQGGASFPLQAT